MRQLRVLNRVAHETALGLKQSGWSNWLVVGILAMALTIFGGILQVTMSMKNVVESWGSQLEISAYLKDDCDPKQVARQVSQLPNVALVEIVPKDVAWQEMQTSFPVASIANPLPNTLHIRLTNPEVVEKAAGSIKTMPGVEHVRYPLKVARELNRFRHFLELAGVVITLALTVATLIVIGNTIHLVIQSKRREIEILSLMGVSPWYIKSPLVLQGAAYGGAAAVLAITIVGGINICFNNYLKVQFVSFMPMVTDSMQYSLLSTFFILLVLGVFVGAGGSAWTSGRYIKI